MKRQTEGGRLLPAGSGRALRLDPFSLPVRFRASDAGADARTRDVELHRERVVVRRRVRGIPMAVNLPVAAFLGVALRVIEPGDEGTEMVCLTLEHPDPGLSIPLYISSNSDDVVAEWQSWAQALQRPLLVTDDSGALHELFAHIGKVRAESVSPRRRRRTAMKGRRPSILLRRQRLGEGTKAVYRGEREIIARS